MEEADAAVAAEANGGFPDTGNNGAWGRRISVHELEVGQKLLGRVQTIRPFGCFVDVGADTDGLVHISRMTGGLVKSIDSLVQPGQEVTVWVSEVREDGKLSLTMVEDMTQDPRLVDLSAFQGLPTDQWLPGKVAAIVDYGAFVWAWPLDEDLPPSQGLVHITEIKDGFVSHPSDELEVDQELQVRVLSVDLFSSRLCLSLKDPTPVAVGSALPDVSGFQGVPADRWLTGTVHHTAAFGAFVEVVPPGGAAPVKGLVHKSQIREGFSDDPALEVDVGQEVEVRIIGVDVHAGKLALSMRPP